MIQLYPTITPFDILLLSHNALHHAHITWLWQTPKFHTIQWYKNLHLTDNIYILKAVDIHKSSTQSSVKGEEARAKLTNPVNITAHNTNPAARSWSMPTTLENFLTLAEPNKLNGGHTELGSE